jgi:hypothetical protein
LLQEQITIQIQRSSQKIPQLKILLPKLIPWGKKRPQKQKPQKRKE